MILYTYVNQEAIFPTDEKDFSRQEMVDIPGGQLLLEKEEGEYGLQYKIVRLFSTDPNMYLENKYNPGEYFTKQ
ncbi:YlzJ-like family protein [Evansella sp. AB-rgal1]|uniref:YlzJ-like family protein n=1 Tax=Evansella sp. AB-rgal1 TaxID=3242696 RepID=UPI00359D53DC